MSGIVKFSQGYGSWVYRCQWGCFADDFESEWEAEAAFRTHDCDQSLGR